MQVNGSWSAMVSPATWRVDVPNGDYLVTVTVGESRAHPGAVRHSVQVEGVVVHDEAITTVGSKYAVASAGITVTDGVLDVTFDGGTRTKIVAIELHAV
jgi:hypothetical protein